jgi:hypothetical protein
MLRKLMPMLAAGAALMLPAAANAGPLRAGAARADITPRASMLPLAGLLKLTSVHDPIYARLLLLDNGDEKLALVSVDAIIVANMGDLIDSLARELKIPRERILISATHDHNGPVLGLPGPYLDFVKASLLDAARQAAKRAQPARVGYRTGKAYVNVNRDEKVDGRYTMGYAPDGPSDKTVAVMTVTDRAGKPIAVYANYAVHGVVMFGSGMASGKVEVTGDLPGATSRRVEEKLGDGVVALWTSGAAGDQNPIFTAVRVGAGGKFEDDGAGGWTLMEAQARRLGDEIVRLVRDTGDTTDSAALKVRTATLTCPGRKPARPGAPVEPAASNWALARIDMVDADPVRIPLTLMTVGDIALAGVAGELFTEIGMGVKAQSPFGKTMVVTNLPDGVGYIPSDRAYTLPSEKAIDNRLKPGCADQGIPATFREMATGLAAQPPR